MAEKDKEEVDLNDVVRKTRLFEAAANTIDDIAKRGGILSIEDMTALTIALGGQPVDFDNCSDDEDDRFSHYHKMTDEEKSAIEERMRSNAVWLADLRKQVADDKKVAKNLKRAAKAEENAKRGPQPATPVLEALKMKKATRGRKGAKADVDETSLVSPIKDGTEEDAPPTKKVSPKRHAGKKLEEEHEKPKKTARVDPIVEGEIQMFEEMSAVERKKMRHVTSLEMRRFIQELIDQLENSPKLKNMKRSTQLLDVVVAVPDDEKIFTRGEPLLEHLLHKVVSILDAAADIFQNKDFGFKLPIIEQLRVLNTGYLIASKKGSQPLERLALSRAELLKHAFVAVRNMQPDYWPPPLLQDILCSGAF